MLAMLAAAGMLIFPKPDQAICAFQQGLNSMTTLASGNNLYVLWESSSGFEGGSNVGNYTLFFKTSNDGGKTFEKTIRIHSATLLPCTFFSHMAIGEMVKEATISTSCGKTLRSISRPVLMEDLVLATRLVLAREL